MKKATASKTPTPPPSLGNKRACPECGTKFYDFGKNEATCPKCQSKIDIEALESASRASLVEKKRPKPVDKTVENLATDEAASSSEDSFEAVEDLGSDEDVAEDIDVDGDDDDDDEN